jgi:MoaA/NifB/PqqE/SkfB family radical SAM enzyme
MNPYRPDKVTLHPERLQALARGVQPVPVQAHLVISDRCNQDCVVCAYRLEGYTSNELFPIRDTDGNVVERNPMRMIPLEKAHAIIRGCWQLGLKAIQITGGGEPTVHPDHARICEAVRRFGLDLGFVTNGVYLSPEAMPALVSPGAETWIRISLDAGDAETYTRERRCPPDHWSRVWSTIRSVVAARAQVAGSPLVIGVSYVLTAENFRGVVEATKMARASGVDNIRISGVFQNAGSAHFPTFMPEVTDCIAEAEALQTRDFAVINQFPDRIMDLLQGAPDYQVCGYQHLCTYIGADLNVYRCCGLAYNYRGLVGSLQGQSLVDLWMSPEKTESFARFDARQCVRCPFNDKNRAIAAAVTAHRHGSFV